VSELKTSNIFKNRVRSRNRKLYVSIAPIYDWHSFQVHLFES